MKRRGATQSPSVFCFSNSTLVPFDTPGRNNVEQSFLSKETTRYDAETKQTTDRLILQSLDWKSYAMTTTLPRVLTTMNYHLNYFQSSPVWPCSSFGETPVFSIQGSWVWNFISLVWFTLFHKGNIEKLQWLTSVLKLHHRAQSKRSLTNPTVITVFSRVAITVFCKRKRIISVQ